MQTFPFTPLPYLLLSWIENQRHDTDKEITFLQKALAITEERERQKADELAYHANTVVDDQEHILSALIEAIEHIKKKTPAEKKMLQECEHQYDAVVKKMEQCDKELHNTPAMQKLRQSLYDTAEQNKWY